MNLLLLFASLFAPAAWSNPLSLRDAIDEAFQNSPRLQQQESALEEAQWKKTESLAGFLPHISASANHLLDKKYAYLDVSLTGSGPPLSFPQVIPTTTYTLDAALPLFDGLSNVNHYRAAGEFAEASRHEFHWAQFRLEREVVLAYYRALGAKVLQEVAEHNLRNLEDHLKDVQAFKKAGVSTNYDVLRVEVQVSEARSAVLDAVDNVQITLNRLGEVLGRSTETRELGGELPVLPPTLAAQAPTAPEKRDDLEALAGKAGGLGRLQAADSSYLVPHIGMFGEFQKYNNRTNDVWNSGAFRSSYMVGFGLSWNLFDGMGSIAKSKESIEQKVQAEKALEIARIHSQEDLDFWHRKYLYYCSVFSSRQSDVEKAREAVRLAREGRRVGTRTNTDLLDAEGDFYRAEAGAVNAQLGTIEALLNLELATGKQLHKFF
jgi:outer membrane protein TolC